MYMVVCYAQSCISMYANLGVFISDSITLNLTFLNCMPEILCTCINRSLEGICKLWKPVVQSPLLCVFIKKGKERKGKERTGGKDTCTLVSLLTKIVLMCEMWTRKSAYRYSAFCLARIIALSDSCMSMYVRTCVFVVL